MGVEKKVKKSLLEAASQIELAAAEQKKAAAKSAKSVKTTKTAAVSGSSAGAGKSAAKASSQKAGVTEKTASPAAKPAVKTAADSKSAGKVTASKKASPQPELKPAQKQPSVPAESAAGKPLEKIEITRTSSKVKDTSSAVYDENSIQHLEGLEHIRLRPGMYIGSLGDGTNENDGIYILLKEGIDNAIDEFSQGFGDRIDIEIKDGRVKIRDFGRGIPLGKLEDCVSNVNTGAKYNNSVFKQAIGMNGVGIKATNALSSYFRAASIRDGKMAVAEYERGKKISSAITKAKPGVKNGTYLEFVPDSKMFGKYEFNMDMVEKRLWNYAYLNPGLKIYCNEKEYLSENGLEDLLVHEMGGKNNSIYKLFPIRVIILNL